MAVSRWLYHTQCVTASLIQLQTGEAIALPQPANITVSRVSAPPQDCFKWVVLAELSELLLDVTHLALAVLTAVRAACPPAHRFYSFQSNTDHGSLP